MTKQHGLINSVMVFVLLLPTASITVHTEPDSSALQKPVLIQDAAYRTENVSLELPPPAVRWKKFENKEWGYAIDYSVDLNPEVTLRNDDSKPYDAFRQRVVFSSPDDPDVLDVAVWRKQADQALTDWIKEYQQSWLGQELDSIQDPNAVVGGQVSFVLQQCSDPPQAFFAYVSTQNLVYRIRYGSASLEDWRQILGSFRLLDNPDTTSRLPDLLPAFDDESCGVVEAGEDPCVLQSAASNSCCGPYNDPPVAHWQCSRNETSGAEFGNCVWWAAHERRDVGTAVGSGSAYVWDENAQDSGYLVDDCPREGDIFVDDRADCAYAQYNNHVAFVTSVDMTNIDQPNVNVTEMHYCSTCLQSNSYPSAGCKFIHNDNPEIVLYWDIPNDLAKELGVPGSCNGRQGVWARDAGLYNVPDWFDNQASAIKVPQGRSVVLFESRDGSGPSVCVHSNIEDFNALGIGGTFPGTNIPINDHISSFEVFDNKYCMGPDTGVLIGRIINSCDRPVVGGGVLAVTWGGAAVATTSESGLYALPGMPAGYALLWAVDPSGTDTGLTWAKVVANTWKGVSTITLEPDTCVELPSGTGVQSVEIAGNPGTEAGTCQPPLRPPDCPQSGGVILFKHENFDCGGSGEGTGYVHLDGPGVYNNVGSSFNDQASSVRVPASWSVKLYQHANEGGGWACRSGDDLNFWGDYFNNGVSLNDNVTSFRVYDVPNCGPNHTPATPSLSSPANGYTAEDGKTPTLCWTNANDPEGDEVEYYAEVYDSPVTANSGWTRKTCWRPAALDGHYHTYKWHVKARDLPHQAQSGWSATRTFSIEPPNQPPAISFNKANGVTIPSSRLVQSNVGNWIFQGTASDPDGQVSQIKFKCSGDDCGSYTSQSGLDNWTHERHGMSGRNDVYFLAYDDDGAVTGSKHLDLRIDLAAPFTTLSLDGDSKAANWPTWFTAPVQVRLKAEDKGTGGARSGVKQIRYRLDGGTWSTQSGDVKTFTVSSDGTHTVEYYAEDKVGNQESTRQVTFKLDATPPTAPGQATESHGAVSGQWQKEWNDPNFTWIPSSDVTSGVRYYQVNWNNTLQVVSTPAYDPPPVRTGSYDLSVRAVDWATNVGPQGAQFTFKYDGTPPHSPDVQNNDGVASGLWQKEVRTADFDWPVPHDEGSGIAGYNLYWGPSITGTNDSLVTAISFVTTTPICAEDEAAVYYLRVRSQDNVGWQSQWVDFALAYDGAPPTATLVANYGLELTNQTSVHLDIASEDQGSGVTQMRLSNDGRTWIDWTGIVTETLWEIPALGRREHTIYLQVADRVGNLSEVVTDTVFLDVNPARPRSDHYWLWDETLTSGGAAITSTTYSMLSSVGQPLAGGQALASASYTLDTGFQAGSQAAPLLRPTYTTYSQTGYVVAGGGTGATALQSPGLKLWGTLGQPADVRTITSTNYTLLSGFWGGAGYHLEIPVPPPPPPPVPPPPECEFYNVTLNNDASFTASPEVTLTLCGPDPVEVMLSNTGEFSTTTWQPYTRTISWTLAVTGTSVQPRFVFARFKDGSGATYGDFSDDIIYDPNAGAGQAVFDLTDLLSETQKLDGVVAGAEGLDAPRPLRTTNDDNVELFLSANDDSSGLADVQLSEYPDFTSAEWQPYSAIVPVSFSGEDGVKTVHVRFRDHAGNISEPAAASMLVDTQPPFGGIAVADQVAGPKFITITAYFGAIDELSGVADMQVSNTPTFTNAVWQPYTLTLALPVSLTTESQGTFFVRYRDTAGNVSDLFSDTYVVDTTPPLVYAEVAAGDTPTRTLTVLAYDELVDVALMHLSNDPLMIDPVLTLAYTQVVSWTFDEREVVWVQVEDTVGNVSEPYPAYAGAQLMSSELALSPGWNLVSWPLTPVSQSLTDTLSMLGDACDQAWTYDARDDADPWKEWPGDLTETDETTGLWIHATEPATLTVTGWQPRGVVIELRAGWNLVGYPSQEVYPVEEALLSLAGKYTQVRAFDPTDAADPWKEYKVNGPAYANDLAVMEPGRGYWIYVTDDCTWTVP